MPYRGLEHPTTPCYRHAAAPATESCARCLHAICDICVGYESTRPHCPPCAKKLRVRRQVGSFLVAVLALALMFPVVRGAIWFMTRDLPFDYGVYKSEVQLLTDRHAVEPCERPNTLKLAQTMLRAGDDRGTLALIQNSFSQCGEWPRLLWVSYTAHERLSEHDAAISDATRLITLEPADKDFWWWRAAAYEQKGDLDHAIADYRQSLVVEPALTGIPFNLANLLERQGRNCDAMTVLNNFLQFDPTPGDRAAAEARLDRLSPLCASKN